MHTLSVYANKTKNIEFIAHSKFCSININKPASFAIPQCAWLKRLKVHLEGPDGLKIVKNATLKGKHLEELILEGLISKEDKLELVSDSLKCIDLRRMQELSYILIKGKAKPIKVGFVRTKLLKDKR